MVEAVFLEGVVVEEMVVTKTAGVMGKLEPLHHNMVGAMDRQMIGSIVTLSLGGLKRRRLMLSSQVIFLFVIAWLLYCLILDPHFHMYLPHFLMVLIYIVICLTCLFVSLNPVGESVIVEKVYRSCLVTFVGSNTYVDLVIL